MVAKVVLMLAALVAGAANAFFLPSLPVSRPVAASSCSVLSMNAAAAAGPSPAILDRPSSTQQDGKVKQLMNQDDFVSALAAAGDKPVVIKFFDTFCRACKAIAPKYETLAQENPGVAFYQVEFRASKALCKQLGITMLPTIQMYVGAKGKVADMPVGPKRFHDAEQALAALLADNEHEHAATGSIHIPAN